MKSLYESLLDINAPAKTQDTIDKYNELREYLIRFALNEFGKNYEVNGEQRALYAYSIKFRTKPSGLLKNFDYGRSIITIQKKFEQIFNSLRLEANKYHMRLEVTKTKLDSTTVIIMKLTHPNIHDLIVHFRLYIDYNRKEAQNKFSMFEISLGKAFDNMIK